MAIIAEEIVSVFKNRDEIFNHPNNEMYKQKHTKLVAVFYAELLQKCKANEAPLFDTAFTNESIRTLALKLLRFDRLKMLVHSATEHAQQKTLMDEIKSDAKKLGELLAEEEDAAKLSKDLQNVLTQRYTTMHVKGAFTELNEAITANSKKVVESEKAVE